MNGSVMIRLRDETSARFRAFVDGITAAGYRIEQNISQPRKQDALVLWNRTRSLEPEAKRFERAGARVLVAENGYLGKRWRGGGWIALAIGHHNGVGEWRQGGDDRWDDLRVQPVPWRAAGEVLILGQRGIGEPGVASPKGWEHEAQRMTGGRIRLHPGNGDHMASLIDDLNGARVVVTWGSAAAIVALKLGVPVFYGMPGWIGAEAALPMSRWGDEPNRSDEARLSMFRRLIWAMWRIDEIRSGEAFRWLLTR